MFIVHVSFHILYNNHKKESQKNYNCIPSRLELTNRTPVKNKEQAEIHQNKSKNLDEDVHSQTGRMSGRPLEYQGDQSKRLQGENEANDVKIEYNREKIMIKSNFCWKTRRKKTKYFVMI